MPLSSTQGMLTGLIRLRSLDASANKLTKIDGALGTLTALQQLNLRGNALLVLSADALRVSLLLFTGNFGAYKERGLAKVKKSGVRFSTAGIA